MFAQDGTLISASAAPHCGVREKQQTQNLIVSIAIWATIREPDAENDQAERKYGIFRTKDSRMSNGVCLLMTRDVSCNQMGLSALT